MGTETVKPTVINGKELETRVVTPASAPAGTLTPAQRAEKYAYLRERMGQSRIKVVGDPNKEYYWARREDPTEMNRLEWLGYSIVKEKDPKKPSIRATGLKEDGTYVIGDVILMEIDKEIAIFLSEENDRKSKALIEGAKSDFIQDRKAEGIPTFERDESNSKKVFHN